MSYGNENGVDLSMPVAPVGYGNNGMGFGGDNGWWILLLFLFGMNGGWGNNGGYGGGNGLYPWMNQADITTSGFQNQMLNTQLMGIQNSVTAGFGDVQNSLCSGFAGVNANISNGFAQAEIGENARQMANMQQMFGLQSQMAQCCCDNRLATCQTQNIVQSEGAATRLAIQNQTQQILDKMCQQEIDALKERNLALQNQVNMQNLAASQTAQTAALIADNTAQTQYIVNRVAPYPIPAYTVANPVTPAATTAAG